MGRRDSAATRGPTLRYRILLIDDEERIRATVGDFFDAHGYEVDTAGSCAEGEKHFRFARPDLVICDFRLPDGDGSHVLETVRTIDASVPLVVVTAHGSVDLAVEMIKEGAAHFVTKPLDLSVLLVVVQRLLDERRRAARADAAAAVQRRDAADPFCGTSEAIQRLRETAAVVAAADAPVLIGGETGSGKGVLARWIHASSRRASEAFVDINSAGLSRELLESEMFGYAKGAFTGAVTAKAGLLEVAHRGTVFLDEIGDIDLAVQPKLLKVVEEKRFRRLGEVQDRMVDIRLIAATHRDLAALVEQERFRDDLYFRINTLTLNIPPLRERREDIPLLANAIVRQLAGQMAKSDVSLGDDAIEALTRHRWPGNIRELRNVIEHAVLLARRPVVGASDLRFEVIESPAARTQTEDHLTLAEVERKHILRVLRLESGNVERAAKRLDVPRSTLYRRLKELGEL